MTETLRPKKMPQNNNQYRLFVIEDIDFAKHNKAERPKKTMKILGKANRESTNKEPSIATKKLTIRAKFLSFHIAFAKK